MHKLIAATLFTFALGEPSLYASSSIDIGLGITRGGTAIGGAYNSKSSSKHSYGGYLRMIPKNEDSSSAQDGITSISGCFKGQLNAGATKIYGIAGASVLMLNPVSGDSETAIGPTLGFGMLHRLNKGIALGIDYLSHTAWNGDSKGRTFTSTLLVANVSI
tara:strand:+ start:673 stop:1155 length:483 start_codon:yes stop_codon:yes gene_type:complete